MKKKSQHDVWQVTPLATLSSDKMLMFIMIGKNTSIRQSITRDVSMGPLMLIRGHPFYFWGVGEGCDAEKISCKCILVEKTLHKGKKYTVAWKKFYKILSGLTLWTAGHEVKNLKNICFIQSNLASVNNHFFGPGRQKIHSLTLI